MKAIVLTPGTTELRLMDKPEPMIQADDEIKLKVLEVGICGTDREEARGGRADPPPGEKDLIIGHEMLGEVVDIGSQVTHVKKGDLALFTVRRGCNECAACKMDCPDMCYSGNYTERGIKQRHGYQAEYVVDKDKYLIKIPDSIRDYGVLCEPMSVVEKAIEEITRIQKARLPDWTGALDLRGRKVLVAGLGPIGLLAAVILRIRKADVLGLDIVDPKSFRPNFLEKIGGHYIDGKNFAIEKVPSQYGQIDLIVEAAGIPQLDFNLFEALGTNGGYVLTGVPGESHPISVDGATIMRQLVLKNQLMLGSVNAGKLHWELAVKDLVEAGRLWGSLIKELITNRFPHTQFKDAIDSHTPNEIKCVINWK